MKPLELDLRFLGWDFREFCGFGVGLGEFSPVSALSPQAMLHYRSRLLRALHTAAFAGLFLSGFAEQSQTLELELMGRYREDPVRPGGPKGARGSQGRFRRSHGGLGGVPVGFGGS